MRTRLVPPETLRPGGSKPLSNLSKPVCGHTKRSAGERAKNESRHNGMSQQLMVRTFPAPVLPGDDPDPSTVAQDAEGQSQRPSGLTVCQRGAFAEAQRLNTPEVRCGGPRAAMNSCITGALPEVDRSTMTIRTS